MEGSDNLREWFVDIEGCKDVANIILILSFYLYFDDLGT